MGEARSQQKPPAYTKLTQAHKHTHFLPTRASIQFARQRERFSLGLGVNEMSLGRRQFYSIHWHSTVLQLHERRLFQKKTVRGVVASPRLWISEQTVFDQNTEEKKWIYHETICLHFLTYIRYCVNWKQFYFDHEWRLGTIVYWSCQKRLQKCLVDYVVTWSQNCVLGEVIFDPVISLKWFPPSKQHTKKEAVWPCLVLEISNSVKR